MALFDHSCVAAKRQRWGVDRTYRGHCGFDASEPEVVIRLPRNCLDSMFLGPRGNPLGATLCQLGLPVLGNEFPRADDFVILVEVHLASMQTGGNCDMKIDGRCHCGFITYEADIDPEKVMVCHCTDCQTLSGSAFRIVAFTRENAFSLLSGEPKIYVKVAESGSKRSQAFC